MKSAFALILGLCCCIPLHCQTAFETASVRPAPPDAPNSGTAFMIGLGHELPPHGLLRMTSALPPLIIFAYGVEDEVEARAMRARLPDWAQHDKFTIVARSAQDAPTLEQWRAMVRCLLEDRFALNAHRDAHTGTVNLLELLKPSSFGNALKPHDTSQPCIQRGAPVTADPPGKASAAPFCGLNLNVADNGRFDIRMVGVTLQEACTLLGGLGAVLGGRSMDRVVDSTGLTGTWDIAFTFQPDRTGPGLDAPPSDAGGPSFTSALEKQLGLRLKKGTGQVDDLIVDHIAPPTQD